MKDLNVCTMNMIDGPKPKHYDNPYIVDSENFKKPPKQFD